MRAFAVRSFGEPPPVCGLPVPAAGGTVLIRVRFAGVNPLDSSLLGRLTAAWPCRFVAGIDFAGVAGRVPAADPGLQAGDRVLGMARTRGSCARYTTAAPGAALGPAAPIPGGVTGGQAAALPIPAATALPTIDLLQATAGQQVPVMGAAGGAGGYPVQLARSRGAHVIAAVRGDAGQARRPGAAEVDDSQAGDVIDALRAAHPDGVDAVPDPASGPGAIRRDAEISRPAGHLVSTIFAAGERWLAQRQITAHNHASSANPLISPHGLATVAQMLADGTITARIRSTACPDAAGQILDKLRHGRAARQDRHPPLEPGRTGPDPRRERADPVPITPSRQRRPADLFPIAESVLAGGSPAYAAMVRTYHLHLRPRVHHAGLRYPVIATAQVTGSDYASRAA